MRVVRIRVAWLIPLAAALGVFAGVGLSLASSTSRKAEASVLISSPGGPPEVIPVLPNLRELATSGVLAGNVRSTLRLKESLAELRDHLGAEVRPNSQVIVISAMDEDADKARQIAQEAAVVFIQLVESRFGERSPPLQAALLDSAHIRSRESRHLLRNALIAAAVGLLLGMVLALSRLSGRVGVRDEGLLEGAGRDVLRKRESQLEQRVKTVSARERKLAERAGELALREQELEKRTSQLATGKGELAAQNRDRESGRPPRESAVSERSLDPEAPAPALTHRGAWNIDELERAADAQREISPEQAEEWRTYLYFLREHASVDGSLPHSFNSLIVEVFADLLE